jgi:hypothetical protein
MHLRLETNKEQVSEDVLKTLNSLGFEPYDALNDYDEYNHLIIHTDGWYSYGIHKYAYTVKTKEELIKAITLANLGLDQAEVEKLLGENRNDRK